MQPSATKTDPRAPRTVLDLIEARARAAPEAPAVACPGGSMTYGNMLAQVERLACAVIRTFPDPSLPVAILVRHGTPSVIGLLAVLKAARIAAPLEAADCEPDLPQVLAHAGCAGALVDSESEPLISALGLATLRVDRPEEGPCGEAIAPAPNDIAILAYTSGSTGTPKALPRLHRTLATVAAAEAARLGVGRRDRIALLSPLATGASPGLLFLALTSGASVYCLDARESPLTELGAALDEFEVTLYYSTPSLFRRLAGAMTSQRRGFSHVRLLRLGGEIVLPSDMALCAKHVRPACRFVHSFGLTELGTLALGFADPDAHSIAEGLPLLPVLPNTALEAVGEAGQLLGPGQVGTLCITSDLLCPGYWRGPHRPPDAACFEGRTGVRTFVTGDLVSFNTDGAFKVLGRSDDRVKVRGRRVYLGQVESVLAVHPAVNQAVARVVDSALVAYVVPRAEARVTVSEMRHHANTRLPPAAVPSHYQILQELPLLPNGKVDRQRLPSLSHDRPLLEAPFLPPSDPVEQRLVELWERLLSVHPIGIQDSFTDLGGDSLQAVMFLDAVQQEYGVNLSPTDLFEAQTISRLRELLVARPQRGSQDTFHCFERTGAKPALFCWPASGQSVDALRPLAAHLGRVVRVYGAHHLGIAGDRLPERSLPAIAGFYVGRMCEAGPGPYLLAGASFGGLVAYEVAQQLVNAGESVALVALLDTRAPAFPAPKPQSGWSGRIRAGATTLLPVGSYDLTSANLLLGLRHRAQRLRAQFTAKLYARLGVTLPHRFRFKNLIDAADRARRRYRPHPPSFRVVLFRTDVRVPDAFVEDESLGWNAVVGGTLEVHRIPGDHGTYLDGPGLAELAEPLCEVLAAASSPGCDAWGTPRRKPPCAQVS